jgi:hypothetical protein
MAVHGNGLTTQIKMGQVGRTHRTRGEGKATEILLHVIAPPNEQNRGRTVNGERNTK